MTVVLVRAARVVLGAALTIQGLSLLSYLVHAWALLTFPFDLDPGEGFDVYAAVVLLTGGDLYGDPSELPFYALNYPPVHALLLAPLVTLLGPSVTVGRLLSVGASLATALVIAKAVSSRGAAPGRVNENPRPPGGRPARATFSLAALQGSTAGVVGGLAFLASAYVYHSAPLARVTSLMLFLSVAGLYCLDRASPARRETGSNGLHRGWVIAGLALLGAAVFTKPVALDAAAAGLAYLALARPPGWMPAAGIFGLAAVGLHGALEWLTAGRYGQAVVVSNTYPLDWADALAHARNFLEIHAVLLLVGLGGLGAELRRRQLSVWTLYFGAGLVTASTVGRWGAGESYFLPLVVSSCVLGGRLVAAALVSRPVVCAAAVAAIALHPVVAGPGPWPLPWVWPGRDRGFQAWSLAQDPDEADRAAGQRIGEFLAESRGPVLSEGAGFVLADHGRILGNPMALRGLYTHGLYDPSPLVGALQARSVDRVVLHGHWYPPPVLAAIGANYDTVERVEMNGTAYLLLKPKG